MVKMNPVKLQALRRKQMQEFFDYCEKVFVERNQMYGDAIRVGGFVGAVTTLIGDAARLHTQMVMVDDVDNFQKQARDTLTDIANYAGIAAAMMEDENFWGGFNAPYPTEQVTTKGVPDESANS
jgi:hypothetical protein